MSSRYDAIVIGAGPAGEVAVAGLGKQGLRVALVERELVGGECAYWACIPSKTLLRAPQVRAEAQRAAGVDRPEQRWAQLVSYRDFMIRNLDDAKQVAGYRTEGIDVYKGHAKIAAPGVITIADRTISGQRIVVATGSEPTLPAIDGLAAAGFWTNREATTLAELPASVIVLGGGPVGIELGQFLHRAGVGVTLLDSAERLIAREEPPVGELIAAALRAEGIDVRLGVQIESVAREHGRHRVRLAGGEAIDAQELLLVTGRQARVQDIGLEAVGIEANPRGIAIDRRCRAAAGVWAIGDVTGVMPFTHVGKYQGRIAAADIAGEEVHADYGAIPRVVFCDPEIATVGLIEAQAREQEIEVATSRIGLPDAIARPWTYEQDPRGELGLIADRRRQVLVGAWAVAPLAGEWIHQAALAIKARIPLAVLRDTVPQFPTFSEAYLKGLEALEPVR